MQTISSVFEAFLQMPSDLLPWDPQILVDGLCINTLTYESVGPVLPVAVWLMIVNCNHNVRVITEQEINTS